MDEDLQDIRAYFRKAHHEAAQAMRDAHRAAAGDSDALSRLIIAVEVSEEQAAMATLIDEKIEQDPRHKHFRDNAQLRGAPFTPSPKQREEK